MSELIVFSKYQGAGNDFIVFNGLAEKIELTASDVVSLCDRRFGIGADGVMIVRRSATADFKMEFYNSDGTPAEMCGNGIRCFAKHLYDYGLTDRARIAVETGAGRKTVDLVLRDGQVAGASVDMGAPVLKAADIPVSATLNSLNEISLNVKGASILGTCVSMGNPHCVLFVDDLDAAPVCEYGPAIETDPLFPNRTNVEFAQVISSSELNLRVWERGVGETLACGTGACAAAVAANIKGLVGRAVSVNLPGGRLEIEWKANDRIAMTGPAVEVFTGEVYVESLVNNR